MFLFSAFVCLIVFGSGKLLKSSDLRKFYHYTTTSMFDTIGIDSVISLTASELFVAKLNPEKDVEQTTTPLHVSTRRGKFLGRLAFMVDLGNKAASNSFTKDVGAQWSPYIAAVYEPFPFSPQSFLPNDVFPFWGNRVTTEKPLRGIEDEFQVLRVADHTTSTLNVTEKNETLAQVSFKENQTVEVIFVPDICFFVTRGWVLIFGRRK